MLTTHSNEKKIPINFTRIRFSLHLEFFFHDRLRQLVPPIPASMFVRFEQNV